MRKVLKTVFSTLWKAMDGLRKVLHLLVLLFFFAIIVGALTSTAPTMPGRAALVIAPAGSLVEQLEGDPYDRAMAELLGDAKPQTLVQDVVDSLAFARDDARIKAVVLDLGGLGGSGMTKLERIGDAIDRFRESGKPVIAYASFYSQGAYYLASHADEVYMHPDGLFMPQGFGSYTNYYSGLIEKLKLDWNVFRVGTHKSAVEPFIREDMSDEDRESRSRLIGQLWDSYEGGIVASRNLDEGAVTDFSTNILSHLEEHDGDMALTAESLGFFDDLITEDELQGKVSSYAGLDEKSERGYKSVEMHDYVTQMRFLKGPSVERQNIGIVVAAGEIMNGAQPPGTIGGESTSRLLRAARMDDSVKAVVLRIDSPGGSSFASEQIRNEVQALRAAGKPVVASMSSTAASGGYWIAMAADRIYARDTTVTGSIGVFGMFPTAQRALETLGITTDGVGVTRWAGEFRIDREMSSDARALFQAFISRTYDEFVSKVADHRGIDKASVDAVAQGQVWTGADALDFGLIDAIGDFDESIEAAAGLANLDAGDYGRKYYEKKLSPTEQLAVDLLGGARGLGLDLARMKRSGSAVERVAGMLETALVPLLRFDDPKGIYAHCLCTIE